jgi:Uma2 family endonuclease
MADHDRLYIRIDGRRIGSKHVPSLKQASPKKVGPHQFPDLHERREVDGDRHTGDGDQVKDDEDVDRGAAKRMLLRFFHTVKFTRIGGHIARLLAERYNIRVKQVVKDATSMPVPLEVYLRSSEYEPDAEYVDGEIEERPMGEFDHNAWQQAIQLWFWQHAKEWNTRVVPEQRLRVTKTRFRVPNVTVLDRRRPIEQIITQPPIAVFEVLSPEDTVPRIKRKLEDYSTMGIPQIWVVAPEDASYSRYEEGQLVRRESFSEPSRGIVFDMNRIKDLFDES